MIDYNFAFHFLVFKCKSVKLQYIGHFITDQPHFRWEKVLKLVIDMCCLLPSCVILIVEKKIVLNINSWFWIWNLQFHLWGLHLLLKKDNPTSWSKERKTTADEKKEQPPQNINLMNYSSAVTIGKSDWNLQRSTDLSHKTSGTKINLDIMGVITHGLKKEIK